MNESLDLLRAELVRRRGNITQIAADSGISYSWLMQFVHGKINNPTVNRISQLRTALDMATPPDDRAA